MVTTDDVTQAAGNALAHVEHKSVAAGHETGCSVDHLEIARLGISEGLKLALQMLREQPVATKTLEMDGSAADQPGSGTD